MCALNLQQPNGREHTGGELLAQSLHALGVEVAFGIHGGHLDSFFMGCSDIGLRLVNTRHETVAVQAAEGYARIKGGVGVAFVTANSGFANGLPGLASAYADRSPILVITSSAPTADLETNPVQGILDQVDIARQMTKFAERVPEPEEIPRFVARAFRVAISGAPGPVLLDFPIDILFRPLLESRVSWGAITTPLPHPPAPSPDAVHDVMGLWKHAKRPVVLVGSGGRSQKFTEELNNLVLKTGTPAFYGPKYRRFGAIDPAYDCGSWYNLGGLASTGHPAPDSIIILGGRTGVWLGGRGGAIIPSQNCRIIQIDADGGEIGRLCPIHVGIISDVYEAVRAFNAAIGQNTFQASKEWLEFALELQQRANPQADKPLYLPSGRMNPYHALREVLRSLEKDAIIILDGGESSLWAADSVTEANAHLMMHAGGYLSLLRNGFGYALGAAIADPSRQVLNVQGDGSAGFHFFDLDTYARFNLNILTVVVNNHAWGMSIHGQELFYGGKNPKRIISKLSPSTQYHAAATALGNPGVKLTKIEEIANAIRKLSGQDGPACIDLIVDDQPIHPTTSMLMNHEPSPDKILIPYYDPIPRPSYSI